MSKRGRVIKDLNDPGKPTFTPKYWSLKNRNKTCDTKFFEIKPMKGVTIVDVYLKEDIDTLRLKLIDDIRKFRGSQFMPDWSKDELVELIKKRFGELK